MDARSKSTSALVAEGDGRFARISSRRRVCISGWVANLSFVSKEVSWVC
jgi:hypothetical protein